MNLGGSSRAFHVYCESGPPGSPPMALAEPNEHGALIMRRFLVVEDDKTLQFILLNLLRGPDREVVQAADGTAALEAMSHGPFDVVITDLNMAPMDGWELMRRMVPEHARTPVIVITSADDLASASRAMDAGAFDYVTKPIKVPVLKDVVQRALDLRNRQLHLVAGNAGEDVPLRLGRLIAVGPEMARACDLLDQLAPTRVSLTIIGEPGTGRGFSARALHDAAGPGRPWVEAEADRLGDSGEDPVARLHAWTGQAAGGTLLLRNLDRLPPALQQALADWHALHRRLEREIPRIVATSEHPLGELAEAHRCVPALANTLGLIQIHLPPLRKRREDLPALCRTLLSESDRSDGLPWPLRTEAFDLIDRYSWPGNVRELKTVLQGARATAQAAGAKELCVEHFPEQLIRTARECPIQRDTEPLHGRSFAAFLREKEIEQAERLVAAYGGDLNAAAKAANVTPDILTRRLRHARGGASA
jgi:DNA-binding NtrC family response regulator